MLVGLRSTSCLALAPSAALGVSSELPAPSAAFLLQLSHSNLVSKSKFHGFTCRLRWAGIDAFALSAKPLQGAGWCPYKPRPPRDGKAPPRACLAFTPREAVTLAPGGALAEPEVEHRPGSGADSAASGPARPWLRLPAPRCETSVRRA